MFLKENDEKESIFLKEQVEKKKHHSIKILIEVHLYNCLLKDVPLNLINDYTLFC